MKKLKTDFIDSRKYDDIFLLGKILIEMDLTDEEKTRLMKKFEKEEINNEYSISKI